MRAYNVSKKSNLSQKEKIALVKSYDTEDLLYVVREFENNPNKFDKEIIQGAVGKLYDMGIMCI